MWKADHGTHEDIGTSQELDRQWDIMRLNGEGSSAQPGRGFAKLDHFGPRRIGSDDRMIE